MSVRHLYVHVPFCGRKCSYCDFAIAVRRTIPVDEYLGAVAQELAIRHATSPPDEPLDTLYLGGGTPSKLGPDGVARLIDLLRSRHALASGAEVTLEVNPDDVNAADAKRWRASGVTRVSVGVQSFSDRVLEWMHRTHDTAGVFRAIDALRAADVTDYSVDLIFALPTELERDWEHDLATAIALKPTHVSLYGLTIEPMTPLGRRQSRGETVEAPEEQYESEYLQAHRSLTGHGFEHYEVSNYGTPGRRARHNSAYWQGVPYIGVGPGAHEFDGSARRWNVREYADWHSRLAAGTDPMGGNEMLTPDNALAESIYLGLRTTDGLVMSDGDWGYVQPWLDAGWGSRTPEGRLVLSPLGWLRLDGLSAHLAHHRSRD